MNATDRIRLWRDDPVQFVLDNFGVTPDAWQTEVLRAFPKEQRMAMKACKGPGKTCVLAWLVWNFIATRPHPKIACTSISGDNLKDGLWTELANWQMRSKFLKSAFEWQKERIISRESPETWWASARQWSKTADPSAQADTLAGLHADYILFVIDEAGGVPDGVAAAAEAALATGKETKLVLAGNPTQVSGPLYRASTSERHLWHLTEISSDPEDPNRTPRVSIKWAQEQIDKYGRDNPWVMVNVLGRFPPSGLNNLLGPDEVGACLGRNIKEDSYRHAAKIMGVDVARFGDDRTVIFKRQGLASWDPIVMRNARTEDIAARVAKEAANWEPDGICVDGSGGYGAGVIDALRLTNLQVHEIQFGGKASDPRYLNKRAEMWFEMAEWIKAGAALPNMPELQRVLCAPMYFFKQSKFQLEEKDQIKARLGYSPDLGDALCLTHSITIMPRHAKLAGGKPRIALTSATYRPFANKR